MKELRGKVAVITGGASGLGRAFADRALEEGMRIVLADIEQGALDRAARELQNAGAEVLPVRIDISKAEQVDDLAKRTLDRFGGVHLLFNNAGVAVGGPVWENSLADWEWVMGVNLWGVIHGVRTFVPIMLAQDAEGHIVNTASMAGLMVGSQLGAYHVTKFGVVALSESLALNLAETNARIKVSVLCPGWVKTGIAESERNRPSDLQNGEPVGQKHAEAIAQASMRIAEQGIAAEAVADMVYEAIRSEQFYILTHEAWKPLIRQRMENILSGRNPV